MPTNTYVALRTETVAIATPSVTFTSIPQGYTDLVVVNKIIPTTNNAPNDFFRFNGDTGSTYSYTYLFGNGSSAGSGRGSNVAFGLNYASSPTTNGYQSVMQIQNYSNATTNKTVISRSGDANNQVNAFVNLWRNTGAITSLTIFTPSDSFAVGSTFTIYGLLAA